MGVLRYAQDDIWGYYAALRMTYGVLRSTQDDIWGGNTQR